MKKIIVSLATASLIASSAMAADKGIDFTTTGQAVLYYNTAAVDGGADLFDQDTARANVGVQLNFNADLKNDFTFGSQVNYLGTLGLEKNVVSNTMQDVGNKTDSNNIADDVYFSKFFVSKKIANTTVKLGRQELPKSLSPLAFSEGWNVFKNTFDAALVTNTDIPDTLIVGAYVAKGNGNNFGVDMADFSTIQYDSKGNKIGLQDRAAYMLTVQNKSIPMSTLTATYYSLSDGSVAGADAYWGDLTVADKSLPMGLKVGLQGGAISSDTAGADETVAFGAKIALKPIKALALTAAYSNVDDGTSGAMRNIVTGNKTPLYTQMIANQGAIDYDADTYLAKVVYNTGAFGKIIAAYGMTDDNSAVENDFNEFDLVHKIKAGNVNFLTAWINQDKDNAPDVNIIRFVARYNF